ncbi:unnamed protein product [Amoebophrya sp. A120]|nr:unnamed protein product [Amoebophrya sp. A120]|eukprot:GSA120T00022871001.1
MMTSRSKKKSSGSSSGNKPKPNGATKNKKPGGVGNSSAPKQDKNLSQKVVGPSVVSTLAGKLFEKNVVVVVCGEAHEDAVDLTRKNAVCDPVLDWVEVTDRLRTREEHEEERKELALEEEARSTAGSCVGEKRALFTCRKKYEPVPCGRCEYWKAEADEKSGHTAADKKPCEVRSCGPRATARSSASNMKPCQVDAAEREIETAAVASREANNTTSEKSCPACDQLAQDLQLIPLQVWEEREKMKKEGKSILGEKDEAAAEKKVRFGGETVTEFVGEVERDQKNNEGVTTSRPTPKLPASEWPAVLDKALSAHNSEQAKKPNGKKTKFQNRTIFESKSNKLVLAKAKEWGQELLDQLEDASEPDSGDEAEDGSFLEEALLVWQVLEKNRKGVETGKAYLLLSGNKIIAEPDIEDDEEEDHDKEDDRPKNKSTSGSSSCSTTSNDGEESESSEDDDDFETPLVLSFECENWPLEEVTARSTLYTAPPSRKVEKTSSRKDKDDYQEDQSFRLPRRPDPENKAFRVFAFTDNDTEARIYNDRRLRGDTVYDEEMDAVLEVRKDRLWQVSNAMLFDDWCIDRLKDAEDVMKEQEEETGSPRPPYSMHVILEAKVPCTEVELNFTYQHVQENKIRQLVAHPMLIDDVSDSDEDTDDEEDPDDGTGHFLTYLERRLRQHGRDRTSKEKILADMDVSGDSKIARIANEVYNSIREIGGKEPDFLSCIDPRDLSDFRWTKSERDQLEQIMDPEGFEVIRNFMEAESAEEELLRNYPEVTRSDGSCSRDFSILARKKPRSALMKNRTRYMSEQDWHFPSWEGFFGQATDLLLYSQNVRANYVPFLANVVKTWPNLMRFMTTLYFGTIDDARKVLDLTSKDQGRCCFVRSILEFSDHKWGKDFVKKVEDNIKTDHTKVVDASSTSSIKSLEDTRSKNVEDENTSSASGSTATSPKKRKTTKDDEGTADEEQDDEKGNSSSASTAEPNSSTETWGDVASNMIKGGRDVEQKKTSQQAPPRSTTVGASSTTNTSTENKTPTTTTTPSQRRTFKRDIMRRDDTYAAIVSDSHAPLSACMRAKGSNPPRTWISNVAEKIAQEDAAVVRPSGKNTTTSSEQTMKLRMEKIKKQREEYVKKVKKFYVDAVNAELGSDEKTGLTLKEADSTGDYFVAFLRACHPEIYHDIDHSDCVQVVEAKNMRSLKYENKKYNLQKIEYAKNATQAFSEVLNCWDEYQMLYKAQREEYEQGKNDLSRKSDWKTNYPNFCSNKGQVYAKILIDAFNNKVVDCAALLNIGKAVLEKPSDNVVIVCYAGSEHTQNCEKFLKHQCGFQHFQNGKQLGLRDYDEDWCHMLEFPPYLMDFRKLFEKK